MPSRLIPVASITIKEDRHRKTMDISDLLDSFSRIGQLQPIVVNTEADGVTYLVAGGRRLATATKLNWTEIDAIEKTELSPIESKTIELEENLKREELPWKDRSAAIYELHELLSSSNPEGWSLNDTAKKIGLSVQTISESVTAYEAILEGNTQVEAAPTKSAALNIIRRTNNRGIISAMAELTSLPVTETATLVPVVRPSIEMIPATDSILNADFVEWVASYDGPKFNFIHCDFPYGVNIDKSAQNNQAATAEGYEDSRETFINLIETLGQTSGKLISSNATIMFWFDMAFYTETLDLLREHLPDFNWYPIVAIWHKSDNSGIISDPKRRMRHVYEAAFYGHRGSAIVANVVSDCYPSPTERVEHMSTKPEPMLRHFFRAFVDKNTRMLDPTCGSGSSIRAAESLDAEAVLGLEINPTFAKSAQDHLQVFRNKRAAAKLTEKKV